jgi:hypothetical protein
MRYPYHRDSEPAQLQDPGPLAQFQRAWGIQGQLPALAEARVQVGISADDLTAAEYWWLRRGKRVMADCQIAASAANFSTFAVQAKPGNIGQVMLVIEKLCFYNATGVLQQIRWGVGPAGVQVSTFFDLQFMDDRQAGSPSTFFSQGSDNTSAVSNFPGAPNTYMNMVAGIGAAVIFDNLNIILTGNQTLTIQSSAINLPLHANVFGRERILNPAER